MTKIGATSPTVKKSAPNRGDSLMRPKPAVQKNRTTVVSRPAKTVSANALNQAPARGNTPFIRRLPGPEESSSKRTTPRAESMLLRASHSLERPSEEALEQQA